MAAHAGRIGQDDGHGAADDQFQFGEGNGGTAPPDLAVGGQEGAVGG